MEDGSLADRLHRERLVDIDARLERHRRLAFAILAVVIVCSTPWLDAWPLVVLVVTHAALLLSSRMSARSARPERWVAAAWATTPLGIALCIATTGGLASPGLVLFGLPAITLSARFERRGVVAGVLYIIVLVVATAVVASPELLGSRPDRLLFAVGAVLATAILAGAVVQSDRDHRRSSVTDPLTGLLNRSALLQRHSWLTAQAPAPVALVLVDVDHFKAINDRHGHLAGDDVLAEVAARLRRALREIDIVHRIGGEEFAVLLAGATASRADAVAERLRDTIGGEPVRGIPVTVSVGVATAPTPDDFGALYSRADARLYDAKRAGRDQVASG